MPYSAENLEQLAAAHDEWTRRQDNVITAFLGRTYLSERGREFSSHGWSRRVGTLRHCLDRTFESVSPEETQPSRSALMDATAFIQSFVINIYAAIDNLAHVWCNEASIVDAGGRPIPSRFVGLRPNNVLVRASLSAGFQGYLADNDKWFSYLESYRHALAHRIPLYIPPRQFNPQAQAEFADLQSQKNEAFRTRDWDKARELFDRLERVGVFEPYIMHSFVEEAPPMRFHAQMICDFATVIELGEYMLKELDQLNPC